MPELVEAGDARSRSIIEQEAVCRPTDASLTDVQAFQQTQATCRREVMLVLLHPMWRQRGTLLETTIDEVTGYCVP